MKTVGIIGGLGPETTAEFYLELIFSAYKKDKTGRPPILLWNVPILYEIEEELLTKAQGEERYIPYLIDAAQRLEKGGADFLVMPCNSLHVFIEEIRKVVAIPVLSIVEECTRFLKEKEIKRIGLLATSTTVKKKLYETIFASKGIQQILPEFEDQERIGELINNIVLKRYNDEDRKELIKIIDKFVAKEVKHVILACTDLQLLAPKHSQLEIYDSMKIFVDATVNYLLE